MKILLAVDGSVYSKRMLAYIAAHEELLGPEREYTVITVVNPLPARMAAALDRTTIDSYYADEADKVLKPVLAFAAQQGWTTNALKPVGRPADLIAEAARGGKVDLVVMGSHGHSSVGGLLLGSVTQRVLALCPVPVLIVR
jgi:nucleotide-binding universal stress UspA family protein